LAEGNETVEVRASTVGDILRELPLIHPALAAPIKAGVSLAVDGRIIAQSLVEPVNEDSEIFVLQRIKGG
jgi:molybdopterin synthase sulfur carrier subunit